MIKYSFVFFIILLGFTGLVSGQNTCFVKIIGEDTKGPIKYCLVISGMTKETYLSNTVGIVKISDVFETDTLTFIRFGYKRISKAVSDIIKTNEIYLPLASQDDLDNSVSTTEIELYSYVREASKKLWKKPVTNCRTYLDFTTSMDGIDIEMSRFYYNTLLQGSKILNITLKSGRVGLVSNKNGFANLTPSLALLKFSPVHDSRVFPFTPLQSGLDGDALDLWNFKQIDARMGKGVIGIKFTPKNPNDDNLFRGEIWINKTNHEIQNLKLTIPDARIHPFVSGISDSIAHVSIETNYHFTDYESTEGLLDFIDYAYSLDYIPQKEFPSISKRITTKGVLHFYDIDNPFFIPKLKYTEDLDDYLKAAIFPFDSYFWENTSGLVLCEEQKEKLNDILTSGIGYNYSNSKNEAALKDKLIKQYSVIYDKNSYLDLDPNIISDSIRADLSVYLYLDINTYNHLITHQTLTILDHLKTRFSLEYSKQNLVFQNIYFDLCEIVRLNLDEKLSILNSVEEMNQAHEAALQDIHSITAKFKSETNYGADIHSLKKWNDLVLQRTGVDNFAVFALKYKAKKRK